MNDMKQKDDTMRATPEANKLFFDEYGREVQVRRELAIEKFRQLECQRDEARELARELRDALKKQQCFILTLINTHPTSLFSRSQNQVNTALNKAKEVLGEA